MVLKLSNKNHAEVMEFLLKEPEINLFIIGDIENFGYENDFQKLYGQYDNNKLIGVLLDYKGSFIPYYSDTTVDKNPFSKIACGNINKKTILSGKKEIVEGFCDIFPNANVREMHFCKLENRNSLMINKDKKVIKAKSNDAHRIYEFMKTIDEFSQGRIEVSDIEHKLVTKAGRIFFIEDEYGKIGAVAQTTAENTKSAMIVGVATRKDLRKKGYMTACLSFCLNEILDEGKSVCLFYDNIEAGRIYHKLGFVDLDKWIMLSDFERM